MCEGEGGEEGKGVCVGKGRSVCVFLTIIVWRCPVVSEVQSLPDNFRHGSYSHLCDSVLIHNFNIEPWPEE